MAAQPSGTSWLVAERLGGSSRHFILHVHIADRKWQGSDSTGAIRGIRNGAARVTGCGDQDDPLRVLGALVVLHGTGHEARGEILE